MCSTCSTSGPTSSACHSSSGQVGAITGTAYANFVKESLRENKPYDQFVREMISAQGQAWENGAIGYYMRDRGMPLDNMATTVRIFLGTRIECAQCHNHPFDKWSQTPVLRDGRLHLRGGDQRLLRRHADGRA